MKPCYIKNNKIVCVWCVLHSFDPQVMLNRFPPGGTAQECGLPKDLGHDWQHAPLVQRNWCLGRKQKILWEATRWFFWELEAEFLENLKCYGSVWSAICWELWRLGGRSQVETMPFEKNADWGSVTTYHWCEDWFTHEVNPNLDKGEAENL